MTIGFIRSALQWHGDAIHVRLSQHPSDWWDAVVTKEDAGPGTSEEELFRVSAATAEQVWERVTDQVLGVFRKDI